MSTLHFCRAAALSLSLLAAFSHYVFSGTIPNEAKIGGFGLGCQAYTFNRFSVFEAIEKTAEAGGKTIEFYPGQKLSPEEPGVRWDHNAPNETIGNVKAKLARHHILAVNYGVVGAVFPNVFLVSKEMVTAADRPHSPLI